MAQNTTSQTQPMRLVKWRVHLARRQPWRAVASCAFIAASAAVAYFLWLHPLAAAVTGLLVFAAVAEFLLPITYRIDAEGVSSRNFLSLRHLKWADVKRCYRDAHGVKLSPLARPSRLEAYRGIYVWLGEDGEAVLDAIRYHIRGCGVT